MSAPFAFTIETRVEELRRILATTGWEFSIWADTPDEEPRIRDIDAAVRLGYERPRSIRDLIKRIWPGGGPRSRSAVERTPMPRGGERAVTVQEYWLTEAELLKLCARSETQVAEAILDEMIAVFIAVRRHLLSTVAVVAHSRRPPAPRLPPAPAPAPVPGARQLPAPGPRAGTLGAHPYWGEILTYVGREAPGYPSWVFEALSLWPVPPHLNVCPAAVRDLARVALGHTLLSSLRA